MGGAGTKSRARPTLHHALPTKTKTQQRTMPRQPGEESSASAQPLCRGCYGHPCFSCCHITLALLITPPHSYADWSGGKIPFCERLKGLWLIIWLTGLTSNCPFLHCLSPFHSAPREAPGSICFDGSSGGRNILLPFFSSIFLSFGFFFGRSGPGERVRRSGTWLNFPASFREIIVASFSSPHTRNQAKIKIVYYQNMWGSCANSSIGISQMSRQPIKLYVCGLVYCRSRRSLSAGIVQQQRSHLSSIWTQCSYCCTSAGDQLRYCGIDYLVWEGRGEVLVLTTIEIRWGEGDQGI